MVRWARNRDDVQAGEPPVILQQWRGRQRVNQRSYRPLPAATTPAGESRSNADRPEPEKQKPIPESAPAPAPTPDSSPESTPDPVPDSDKQRGRRWPRRGIHLAALFDEHRPHPRSWRCTGCLHPWPCLACQDALLADAVTDPGQTLDTAYQFLHQAATALDIPPDVLRYRFLPWTLDRTDRLRHSVNRHTFDCEHCDQPWPCPPARAELIEAYAGDPLGLADLMTRLFVEATTSARLSEAELIERFITWPSTMLGTLEFAAAWSPTGIHNAAIIEARHTLEAHWPDVDGRCPLCDVPNCWAWQAAVAFLSDHTPWTPFPPE